MSIPSHPFTFMRRVYKDVFPVVHHELNYWRERAAAIPNKELRNQALASIDTKSFHCEGGSILSLLSSSQMEETIRFVVAYQIISDYLDNLCDRSTSLDPNDFACMHESMGHALTVDAQLKDYYAFREDKDDGSYLCDLVSTCQTVLKNMPHHEKIHPYLLRLSQYYSELQVHKHVVKSERVPRLEKWFELHRHKLPEMEWYEFSACTGSTLGIFCLVSAAMRPEFTEAQAKQIYDAYFPFVQGAHILLDYFIDQAEDEEAGDLNFCNYYQDKQEMAERMSYFIERAEDTLQKLPHAKFHQFIHRGLLAVYLSDEKVKENEDLHDVARTMLNSTDPMAKFFYWNRKMYQRWQKIRRTKESVQA
ncbi:tetraprenyl-beta-curcumene synthase family protein [Bacillus fonticola]|uniref:tetraprenyl-beta-curcumene synthase family protein n=1 Tax=Bacillus fonticola TaxID=2728853 RepID=UPI001472CFDA|nr:tetraprenyl-beta-curcumene synthase family protein [Bacillus fonticola]